MSKPTENVTSTDSKTISLAMSADYKTLTLTVNGTSCTASASVAESLAGKLAVFAKVMHNP